MKKEIIFSGSGGQGLGVMGEILAIAAVLEKKEVASASSYGGEVTGGFSQSGIVISDEKIDFPDVLEPDILVVMSQSGYDNWISKVSLNSKVFFDINTVGTIQPAKAQHIPVPAMKIANELGSRLSANMVMLGAVVAVAKLVSLENLFNVIKTETGGLAEINLRAAEEGYKLGKKYLRKQKR